MLLLVTIMHASVQERSGDMTSSAIDVMHGRGRRRNGDVTCLRACALGDHEAEKNQSFDDCESKSSE